MLTMDVKPTYHLPSISVSSSSSPSSLTTSTNSMCSQQMLNYATAMAAAAAAAASTSSSSASDSSTTITTTGSSIGGGGLDLSTAARLLSPPGGESAQQWTLGGGHGNNSVFGGTTISSELGNQLLAASLLVSSKDSKTKTSQCPICGHPTRDQSEYELHIISHADGMFNSPKAYQYGLNLLRMHNLLNGDASNNNSAVGTSNNNNNTTTTSLALVSPKASSTSTNSVSANPKKRKLLGSISSSSNEQNQQANNNNTSLGEKDFDQMMAIIKRSRTSGDEDDGGKSETTAEQLQKIMSNNAKLTSLSSNNNNNNNNSSAANLAAMATAFPCTSCHKTFATEVDLKAHLIRHLTQHPFVCINCGKGFKYEHSLNFHFKQYHSGGGNGNKTEKVNTNDKLSKIEACASGSNGVDNKKRLNGGASKKSIKLEQDEAGDENVLDNSILANTLLSSGCKGLFGSTSYTSQPNGLTNTSTPTTAGQEKVTLIDENHNAMASALGGKFASGEVASFLVDGGSGGTKLPANMSNDGSIQIRTERGLISLIQAYNVVTEQSFLFYKCQPCSVAFANLDQIGQHIQNVHMPNNFASVIGTAHGGAGDNSQMATTASHMRPASSGESSTPITMVDDDGKVLFQCDKCTAKFAQLNEFEVHSQLHRIDQHLNVGGLSNANNNNNAGSLHSLYSLNLLNTLNDNSPVFANSNQSANLIDFRQILANASKDTDFGRKFAAQLLVDKKEEQFGAASGGGRKGSEATGNGNKMLINSLHHLDLAGAAAAAAAAAAAGFDSRCSPAPSSGNGGNNKSSKLPANDPNNNSLLYMSLLPEHGNVARAQYLRNQAAGEAAAAAAAMALNLSAGTPASSARSAASNKSMAALPSVSSSLIINSPSACKSAKSSSSSSPASSSGSKGGYSSKQIKEPVDIFEGAGQSLPIQKFDLGDIEETAPGVFKCRFCDKTFDRIFSVHRHERVHTGFKPCICKTCGRGFSEKRNLRHHIIRFHSDGSGRELLKRKRKPRSGGNGSSCEAANNGAPTPSTCSSSPARAGSFGMRPSLSRHFRSNNFMAAAARAGDEESVDSTSGSEAMMNQLLKASGAAAGSSLHALMANAAGNSSMMSSLLAGAFQQQVAMRDELGDAIHLAGGTGLPASSSRRRKSKPSRKLYSEDEDQQEETENMVVSVDPMINDEEDLDEDEIRDEEESKADKHDKLESEEDNGPGDAEEKTSGNENHEDGDETEKEEENAIEKKIDPEQTDNEEDDHSNNAETSEPRKAQSSTIRSSNKSSESKCIRSRSKRRSK